MSPDRTDTFRDVVPPRPLNAWEREAISLILAAEDAGAHAARIQLESARVRSECSHCPSVDFEIDASTPPILRPAGTLSSGGSAALHGSDTNGISVQIILIARDGRVAAMDAWRGDGEALAPPPLDGFERTGEASWAAALPSSHDTGRVQH